MNDTKNPARTVREPVLSPVDRVSEMLFGLFMALNLVRHASGGELLVYQVGEWPAPFGIVLVLDRLSALMVTLTAVLESLYHERIDRLFTERIARPERRISCR